MIFGFNTDIKYGNTVYHVQSEAREHDSLLQTQVFVKGRCLGKYATSFAEEAGHADFSEDQLHDLLKAQHKRFVEFARAGTIEQEIEASEGSASHHPVAATAPPAPVVKKEEPKEKEEEEERISISLDDPDLAAIAEASAAAVIDHQHVAPAPAPPPPPILEEAAAPHPPPPPDPMLDSFMAELEAAEKEPPPPPLAQYRVEPAGSVIGKGVGLECLEPIVAPDGSSVLLNVHVVDDGAPSPGAQITCRISMPSGPAAYVYSQSNNDGMADVRIGTHGLDPNTGILIQATVRGKSASRKFTLKRT